MDLEKAKTKSRNWKKEYFDNFVEHCIDSYTDEDGKICDTIDIDYIVDKLHERNIQWRGQTVTPDMVREEIKYQVGETLKMVLQQMDYPEQDDDPEHPYAYTFGACFKTECRMIDGQMEIQVNFVPEEAWLTFNYENFKDLAGDESFVLNKFANID